ncbi:MAG TPA: RHS repeat-associated core domain-containing protein [Dehalococcoidia bacterium]|nr:RHS repeat-associated core domain-containing protein [Dehalococcoidia bacterium]
MTYRLTDGLGSTVNLADEDGEPIGSYEYDVFGNVRAQDGAETEFSFAGEQSDPNGLDFLRARYYDPEIGRFLSGDPLGGGYGYASNNPVNAVDPSGLLTCSSASPGSYAAWSRSDGSAGCYDTSGALLYCEGACPQQIQLSSSPKPAAAPKAAPTPTPVNVGAPTPTTSDAVHQAAVAGATQQPVSGGVDLGVDMGVLPCVPCITGGESLEPGIDLNLDCRILNQNYNGPDCRARPANVPVESDAFGAALGGCIKGALGAGTIGKIAKHLYYDLPYGEFDFRDIKNATLKAGMSGCITGAATGAVGLDLPGPF